MSLLSQKAVSWGLRVGLLASAVTAVVAISVAAERVAEARAAAPEVPAAVSVTSASEPIDAEARVFLTSVGMLGAGWVLDPQRPAHPRTLATHRGLRAYSGAPPRIPHGLTPREFQSGSCNTCHERGGYSLRFGAYVPVTPHPEMGACLQCHVGDAKLMALALPSTDPNDRCRQCHAPGAMRWRDTASTWRGLVAPSLAKNSLSGAPPPIPHDLQLRGNCLACHSSPGGVLEIRTSHPERTNCRQCHVTSGDAS